MAIIMNLKDAIKEARNKKANFKQTFDLIINLKNLDLKRPENRIKTEINLPKPLGKPRKIAIIADVLIPQTKGLENIILIKKDELPKMNKKQVKNIASQVYMFIAEAPLMPLVGKHLGQVLAPRGMMPKPIPPTLPNLKSLVEKMSRDIKINVKTSPTVQAPLGTEDMSDEDILANAQAIITVISGALPRGKEQIKSMIVKTTMGKPVKVSEW